MSEVPQGGTGVGLYPLGVRGAGTREPKTPGSRKNIIRGIRGKRRLSRGKGVIRTPSTPFRPPRSEACP